MTAIRTIKGDITEFTGDVIVNAANSRLSGGGGVDGAIHRAGGQSILDECRRWVERNGPLPTGEAMITGGGLLQARFVIHTVGPVWADHDPDTAHGLLASCYRKSLDLATENECATIAFPHISTGVYGFPKREAAETAVTTVREWLETSSPITDIVFVSFDEENHEIYEKTLSTDRG